MNGSPCGWSPRGRLLSSFSQEAVAWRPGSELLRLVGARRAGLRGSSVFRAQVGRTRPPGPTEGCIIATVLNCQRSQ